jgi:hypothetical protein
MNPLVVLMTRLIIKNTKIQVLKMLLLRLLMVRMHPRGNKRLGYPLLLHLEDKEGQRLYGMVPHFPNLARYSSSYSPSTDLVA